jgi:D-arabinose 1-dehydrogenase-like Zn-dependent alcohol dehydrogenase
MPKIKAYAVKSKGKSPVAFFYERKLGKRNILVRITHCTISRGDLHFIDNDWGDTKFPLVPGHEIIGIVEKTGTEAKNFKLGDRVGIGYQQSACFKCDHCLNGNEQFCLKQKVIGVDCYGGLANQIIVDERFAFKIPDNLKSAKTVPFFSSGLTVFRAIKNANLKPKSTTAVLGIGGLGHLAIQFLEKMEHDVSAFSHSPQKKKVITRLKAKYIDNSKKKNLLKLKNEFDFILSTLNCKFDLDLYLQLLKPTGTICLVGLPINKLNFSVGLLADYAQKTISGNYIGSRKDMKEMLKFASDHQIKSIVEVRPFSEMKKAVSDLKNKKIPIKLVLKN